MEYILTLLTRNIHNIFLIIFTAQFLHIKFITSWKNGYDIHASMKLYDSLNQDVFLIFLISRGIQVNIRNLFKFH